MNPKASLVKKYITGIITGAADDDPTGISTYSVVGATTGYSQLWLMGLSTPMLIVVQGMCAKIGDVTKKGLGKVIAERYGMPIALTATFILIISNIVTIAADLLGVAAGLNLLYPSIPIYGYILPVGLLLWYLVLFNSYRIIVRFLLVLSLFLASYVISGILAKPDWWQVLQSTVYPKLELNIYWLAAAVALLGTTITPYLFYWQSDEEVEEHRTVQQGRRALKAVIPGMIYSNIIAAFIIISSATVFFNQGLFINSASDAALALKPLAGNLASVIFAIGLVGAGLLAIPVLAASTSYATAETFGWKTGLNKTVKKAKGFYAVMTIVFVISSILAFSGIDPIKALFYSQVLTGILAPVLLALIIKLASDNRVMGKYKNNFLTSLGGWMTVGIMTAAAVAFLISLSNSSSA